MIYTALIDKASDALVPRFCLTASGDYAGVLENVHYIDISVQDIQQRRGTRVPNHSTVHSLLLSKEIYPLLTS